MLRIATTRATRRSESFVITLVARAVRMFVVVARMMVVVSVDKMTLLHQDVHGGDKTSHWGACLVLGPPAWHDTLPAHTGSGGHTDQWRNRGRRCNVRGRERPRA